MIELLDDSSRMLAAISLDALLAEFMSLIVSFSVNSRRHLQEKLPFEVRRDELIEG